MGRGQGKRGEAKTTHTPALGGGEGAGAPANPNSQPPTAAAPPAPPPPAAAGVAGGGGGDDGVGAWEAEGREEPHPGGGTIKGGRCGGGMFVQPRAGGGAHPNKIRGEWGAARPGGQR